MKSGSAPSLSDVARRAGVSTMTASRAFRTGCYVAEKTRRRVERAAEALGYRPDARMRELMAQVRRRDRPRFTGTLALLKGVTAEYPKLPDTEANRVILAAIARRADELGYALYEHDLDYGKAEDRVLRRVLRARGVRGLLVFPPPGEGLRLPFRVDEEHCALVLGNAVAEPRLHRVTGNERSAMRVALRELEARGYRRPGLVMHRLADAFSQHAWTPEFLAYQLSLPKRDRVPPCVYPEWSKRTPPELAAWVEKHRPDVILATDLDTPRWLEAEGWNFPRDMGFACLVLETEEAKRRYAGVDKNLAATGELFVDQLVALLQRGEAGEPALVVDTFVEATWNEGATLRGCG
jgi:hypothetical protein